MGAIMQFVWWTENVNQRAAVVSCLKYVSETMENFYGPVFLSRFARGTSRIKAKRCRTLPSVVLFVAPSISFPWIFATSSHTIDVDQYVAELRFVCKRASR